MARGVAGAKLLVLPKDSDRLTVSSFMHIFWARTRARSRVVL